MTERPTSSTSLSEAREYVDEQAAGDGVNCPCCGQFAKVYRRRLNTGMARSLITMWRSAGREWQHVPTTVGGKSREEGKLRYWGLVEERTTPRDDGGRAGWWRVTEKGERFVRNGLAVPQYAIVYNGAVLDLDGGPTNIVGAIGSRFDYRELMSAPGGVQ